ncbi:hypothetical protein C3K47_10460 [Solitalea longa]|uniref:Thioredoxin domain-containing protein n=1 Tax=Solitalea longa TaxID=2079460 RepID=A0A2S5A2E9_9SPHI|nr:protein disulfide isomerase family protein [Solitalea longa]POY36770.1 hypothetical protein C3K47_10460 [Solitalea longa]
MKLKHILLSVSCLLVSFAVNAQDRSINFEHDATWAQIKAKAVKEKKIIFMDCYTSWCGPCKKLAKEVFTYNEVADYFNTHFINAKFDMEKGEGPDLAKQYGVKAYPTLIFIDAEGKLISKREGALEISALLDFAKKSVSGESLEFLQAEYNKGNTSPEFMKKFMTRMEGQRANTSVVIEDYFTKIPQEKWQSADNWYFITRYVKNESSPVFKYVLQNQQAYEKKYTAAAVSDYFVVVYGNTIQKTANSIFAVDDLKDLKERFSKMSFTGKGKLELECDAVAADISKDYKTYVDVMATKFAKYPEKDKADHLYKVHYFCWKMLSKTADTAVLKKVADMAAVSLQIQDPGFMDTYANLLLEIGEFDKAVATEEKVIALLKVKASPDITIAACEKQIEKFKRRKAQATAQSVGKS